jgi:ABC-type transporter Mla subunit MlaD
MSNEDFEKKAEFIVEQQAQFASKIGQLEDIVGRLAKATLDRFEASDKRVNDIDERIAALISSQMKTEENVKKTDEHLRNLIAVVDRYFSEGRNGGSTERE